MEIASNTTWRTPAGRQAAPPALQREPFDKVRVCATLALSAALISACGGGGSDVESPSGPSDAPAPPATSVAAEGEAAARGPQSAPQERAPAPAPPREAAVNATNRRNAVPATPSLPAGAIDITKCSSGNCAKPDDGKDDTAAIQAALDGAMSGQWLVFPPGRYQIDGALKVRVPGLTLWGKGATVDAAKPEGESIVIEADNTSIYGFRLTPVTARAMTR